MVKISWKTLLKILKWDDLGGFTPIFGSTPIYHTWVADLIPQKHFRKDAKPQMVPSAGF